MKLTTRMKFAIKWLHYLGGNAGLTPGGHLIKPNTSTRFAVKRLTWAYLEKRGLVEYDYLKSKGGVVLTSAGSDAAIEIAREEAQKIGIARTWGYD